MDTNQYIEMFLDESSEHLQAVNDNLLKLEKHPQDLSLVSEIFRSAHTLKGMAATMEFKDIASLTHQMENVLDKIRHNELAVSTEVIDITFTAIEYLEEMVQAISEGNDGKKDVTPLVEQLEQMEKGGTNAGQTADRREIADVGAIELDDYQVTVTDQAKEQGFQAFQITVRLRDDCILKGVRAYMVFQTMETHGEFIKTIPAMEDLEEGDFEQEFVLIFLSKSAEVEIQTLIYNVSEVAHVEVEKLTVESDRPEMLENNPEVSTPSADEAKSVASKGTPTKTIRVNLERIDHLMNLFEEIVIDRSRLEDLAEKIKNPDLTETVEHMTRVSEDMQSLILAMRMVPVEQVFNRFPRMVRGLARDLEKEIDLEIIGAETELDRTVIDEIGDPLVHLIRNSVDHGIELPERRKASGKAATGTLILRAFHSGNHVFIEIEDDGAGINREKVESKAIENGLISEEESKNLSDDEISQLILSPGFSTTDEISDVSGRGVGLDVVKSKIESLGGEIAITSEQGTGSRFSIQLPLTLSILSTLLVKVQYETYAVPLSSIVETVLLKESEMMYAHGQKVMDFRGNIIPLISLKEVFQVPEEMEMDAQHHAVVVVNKGDKMTGLIVDSFIGQREVVLKSLGNYLRDVYAISGATILGDGHVSLIIDPNALIR